jgi:hypothetical protein
LSASRPDPFTLPEWRALHREAALVSQIIGSGVTALGRASYANGFGEYYTAFFGLSVGMERLAKLIIVADFALDNRGALPRQSVVRKSGHDVVALVEKVDGIVAKRGLRLSYPKPFHPICASIIRCLAAFADASKGRYANFEAIGNPKFDIRNEPVNKWWIEVVEPILDKHYRGKRSEEGVRNRAALFDAMIGNASYVRHLDENDMMMTDIRTASERTGQTKWAQKYGRYYTLLIIRWLSNTFSELTRRAGYENDFTSLFGHYELFASYCTTDDFLLTRKIWPLT